MKLTIIIFLILLISCGESKSLTNPNQKEDRAKDFKTVSLEELLVNKGKYHKQYIETEGYYLHSFEISGLYNVIAFPSADTVMEIIDYSHSIWIEFDRNQFSLDSVQKKLIKVSGLFDTTLRGHLGKYKATLLKAIVTH